MLFALHFTAHVRWKYSKSYDKKSWYRSFPSLYSMLDSSFRQWPVDPGYLLSLGGENEKLQSSYVGIFLFICRIKQKGIPGTSKHVISFRWKKGHLSGSSHVANTHSHHFWEGDEAQVSMLPRCAGVVFCAFQVVGFFSDLEKWKRNTKNGHVIHVPVLTKILFFSKWVETTT